MYDKDNYLENLKIKMDAYAHFVYAATKKLPKEELFGITSQLRRSALSVVLNFIEGYARRRSAVKKNFWEISYGSLKESKYLIQFANKEEYISSGECQKAVDMAEEIGAMLWKAMISISG